MKHCNESLRLWPPTCYNWQSYIASIDSCLCQEEGTWHNHHLWNLSMQHDNEMFVLLPNDAKQLLLLYTLHPLGQCTFIYNMYTAHGSALDC